ncbi:MAG: hypothetical protein Tsb0010_12720 [Parvularculaceae bacterium]
MKAIPVATSVATPVAAAAAIWLAAAPAQAQDAVYVMPPEVGTADAHILVVRHAYNECGALDCDLTEEGYRQAAELARILGELRTRGGLELDAVVASSACRTVLTVTPAANDAGLPVQAYHASGDAPLCSFQGDGDGFERPGPDRRPVHGVTLAEGLARSRQTVIEAAQEAAESGGGEDAPFVVLVGDHSNYVCGWAAALGVPESDYSHDCGEEGLEHTDFADIYWIYDSQPGEGAAWRLMHFENAFDRGVPNPMEENQTEDH